MSENVSFGEDLTYTPFEVLDPRFKPLVNGTPSWSGSTPAAAGPRGRRSSGAGATSVVGHPEQPHHALGRARTAASPCSASPPTTPTATRSTGRAGSSPASISAGASAAPRSTAPSRCWPTRWNGKRLNSPNDVVVKSDGSIWFTDPAYGIDWDYEGERAESEIGALPRLPDRSAAPARWTRVADGLRAPERPRLLARRVEALHRRHRRDPCGERPAAHPRVRRRRRQDAARRRGVRHLHGRPLRRLPRRRGRPDLDLGGRRRARATSRTAP